MREWINIITEAESDLPTQDAGHEYDTLEWEQFSSRLKAGPVRLYRVMNLPDDPVKMITQGHRHLGLCWSYDLAFLMHGNYDFGYGGGPENWFYFAIDVDPTAVDWEATETFFTELSNFEKEVRLLPNQPVKLVGISNHFGKRLDCSSIMGVPLTTGADQEGI